MEQNKSWQKGSQLPPTIIDVFVVDMYMYVIKENCLDPAFTSIAAMIFFKTATHHLRGMHPVIYKVLKCNNKTCLIKKYIKKSFMSIKRGKSLFDVSLCFGYNQEAYIAQLDAKSGASLKLTILNSKGRIWTMVAGGGASVVYR